MYTDVSPEQWDKEVWEACAGPSATAPGEDTSTTSDCRAVWPELGPILRALYRRCVQLAYVPKPWRRAEVVEIPKPGKPAQARKSPKGWRPVSLISVPAKGLFGPLQAGAVPNRSATDLLAALVYTAEAGKVS